MGLRPFHRSKPSTSILNIVNPYSSTTAVGTCDILLASFIMLNVYHVSLGKDVSVLVLVVVVAVGDKPCFHRSRSGGSQDLYTHAHVLGRGTTVMGTSAPLAAFFMHFPVQRTDTLHRICVPRLRPLLIATAAEMASDVMDWMHETAEPST